MAADEGSSWMKKTAVMGVAALVAAMSLGVAAPASAQTCSGNFPPLPASNTISTENGQLRINPNGPAEDADNAGDYANDRADEGVDCALGSVPPQAWCAYELAYWGAWYGYYAYVDTNTGEVVVDYGRLTNDTNSCL
jgi:hypothetical protein